MDDIIIRRIRGKRFKQIHYTCESGDYSALIRCTDTDIKVDHTMLHSDLAKHILTMEDVDRLCEDVTYDLPSESGVSELRAINSFGVKSNIILVCDCGGTDHALVREIDSCYQEIVSNGFYVGGCYLNEAEFMSEYSKNPAKFRCSLVLNLVKGKQDGGNVASFCDSNALQCIVFDSVDELKLGTADSML